MTAWIVETLVASSLLMLGVLLLRGPVANMFGPRVAYALWLVPALRMVLPPLPATVIAPPMASLPKSIDLHAIDLATLAMPSAQIGPVETPIDWAPILLAVWLGGATVHFLWHLLAYRRFVTRTLATATQLPRLDRSRIEVCASPAVRGPFATGIFLKTIVLPADYRRRYTADELRLAIVHETEHHHRCDMSVNLLALLTLSLHWFNPIAHRAHRAFRVDQELACDAIVLADASPAERHAYGSALLKSACDRLPVAACALGAGDDLKRRLRMMATTKPSCAQMRAGGVIATILTGAGLLLTASGGIAAETTRKVEKSVRTAMREVKPVAIAWGAPAPPAAPAAPAPPLPPAPVRPVAVETAMMASVEAHRAAQEARAAARAARAEAPDREAEAEAAEEAAEAATEAAAEAAEAAREIAREVAEAAREASQEAREAVREAQIDRHRIVAEARAATATARAATRDCARTAVVRIAVHGSSSATERSVTTAGVCPEKTAADGLATSKVLIEALEDARKQIAESRSDHFGAGERTEALASLDRQLNALRTRKP